MKKRRGEEGIIRGDEDEYEEDEKKMNKRRRKRGQNDNSKIKLTRYFSGSRPSNTYHCRRPKPLFPLGYIGIPHHPLKNQNV